MPGVAQKVSQIDGTRPSSCAAPSIWYDAVAAPNTKPGACIAEPGGGEMEGMALLKTRPGLERTWNRFHVARFCPAGQGAVSVETPTRRAHDPDAPRVFAPRTYAARRVSNPGTEHRSMRNHPLGRTGLFVSELCLGTMTFGGTDGIWGKIGDLGQADAERLVGQAIDAGINFIDTADVYAGGVSETITGQALKNLKIARESVVVATKVFGETGPGANGRGASRGHIMDGVKASLKRLQLDHIDLYQIHGFDPATPIEETVRALDQLVRHGHVRYVGVSNWAAWQIVKALGIAERLGLSRFESLQAYYTVAGRDLEREIVPMLQERRPGPDGVEPAGGRPAERQVQDGRERGGRQPPPDLRLPAGRPRARRRRHRRDAADRRGQGRVGGADRAGLAAAPAAGHQRDRRRQAARPAGRQHRRDAGRR